MSGNDLLHETHALMANTYGDHFGMTVRAFEAMITFLYCLKTFSEPQYPKSPEIDGWILSYIVYSAEMGHIDIHNKEELLGAITFENWLQSDHGQRVREEKEALRSRDSQPVVTRSVVDRIYSNASDIALQISILWANIVEAGMVTGDTVDGSEVEEDVDEGTVEKDVAGEDAAGEDAAGEDAAGEATVDEEDTVDEEVTVDESENETDTPIQKKSKVQRDLEKMTLVELKWDARLRRLRGFSRLNKVELIKKILEDQDVVWVEE